jgi:hypothetical protein
MTKNPGSRVQVIRSRGYMYNVPTNFVSVFHHF